MAPRKNVKENNNEEKIPPRALRPKIVNKVDPKPNENQEVVIEKKKVRVVKPKDKEPKEKEVKKKAVPKAAPKPKKAPAAKGHKLPDPIKPGQVFVDSAKKSWKVGKSLGSGGFGEVYSATDDLNEKNVDVFKYVMKVEYSSGPLFVEQHFYVRCAKPEHLEAWKKEKKVKVIGIPAFYAMKGQQEHDGNTYRFIVITKFGDDLQKLLDTHGKFSLKNTATIACSLMDTLEYIHHCGYVHADLKPANILLGTESSHAPVNIVDFGLATKYMDSDDKHVAHVIDKKNAHNGTLIYTSAVAHRGVVKTSRICDVEILAYNLLHMFTGFLPWSSYEKQPAKVLELKEALLKDPATFFNEHYMEKVPDVFVDLFKYVASTDFALAPNYSKIKQMFVKAAQKSSGTKLDGKLDFNDQSTKSEPTAALTNEKEVKPKRGGARKKVAKVDDDQSDKTDDAPPHVDETALRFVNTKKRTLASAVGDADMENENDDEKEENDDDEQEELEEKVQEKRKKRSPKNAINLNCTYVVPTPAMLEVMSKQNEKKATGGAKRGKKK